MRRTTFVTLTLLLFAFVATAAFAQSPHFVKGPNPSLDTQTGDLTVSFKEAGLGNTPITYSLEANKANFTFQCFTKSGNEPKGDPNFVSLSNDSTFVTLDPRNGQITGSISLSPEQGGADCQGNGLVLKLIQVEYQNVRFCDSTNNICLDLGTFGPIATNIRY